MNPFRNFCKIIQKKILRFIETQDTLSIQLDITNHCNLCCRHCYQNTHSTPDLSFEEWVTIIEQYDALLKRFSQRPRIVFSGGEPSLSPLLPKLIEHTVKKWGEYKMILLTNGTLLTDDLIFLLKKHKVEVQVSLDGSTAEKHDFYRGQGNFEKALLGIDRLIKNQISVSIQTILSQKTTPEIEEFFLLAKRLNVSSLQFARLIVQGNAKELIETQIDKPLSSQELKTAYHQILNLSQAYSVPTNTNKPLWAIVNPKLGANGRWGFQSIVVDHRGNLKVSSRINLILGNLFEKNMTQLFWEHPTMKALRSGKIQICGTCHLYSQCGGDRNAAYAEFGDILAPDPACWLNTNRGSL